MFEIKKQFFIRIFLIIIIIASIFAIPIATYASEEDGTFTLEELLKYDGKNGAKAYIALDGIVYDVTEDQKEWFEGEHPYCQGCSAGSDLTEIFSSAPKGHFKDGFMDRYSVVGTMVESKPQATSVPTPKPTPTPKKAVSTPTSVMAKASPAPTKKKASPTPAKTLSVTPEPAKNSTDKSVNKSTKAPEATSVVTPSVVENTVLNTPEPSNAPAANNEDKPLPVRKISIKRNLLTRDHVISIGWLSLMFFILSCMYYFYKRMLINVCKLGNKGINEYISKIIRKNTNYHCWLGLFSAAFAIIHILNKISEITFSISYLCLLSLLIICVSGILGKYLKLKHILGIYWHYMHITTVITFIITFLYHFYDKLLR